MAGLVRSVTEFPGAFGPIVLTGVGEPEIRHRVAENLNRAFGEQLGGSVLVMAEGTAGGALAHRPGPGLLETMRGEVSTIDSVVFFPGQPASYIPLGTSRRRQPSATERGELPRVWAELTGAFHAVLVQAGVPSNSPLTKSVLQTAGRIVVVLPEDQLGRKEMQAALRRLDRLGLADRVVGAVVVESDRAARYLGSRNGSRDGSQIASPDLDGVEDGALAARLKGYAREETARSRT
jgi:hypothetical protein